MADDPSLPTTDPLDLGGAITVAPPTKIRAPFVTIDYTDQDLGQWKARIALALEVQKRYRPWWEQALKNYGPQVGDSATTYGSDVRTNRAFGTVERKVADLAYRRGEVTVAPSPLLDALPQGAELCAIHAAILNEKLGLDGIDAASLTQQAAFDYEMFGAGWIAIGYRAHTVDVQQPKVDPATGAPIVDPLTGAPVTETVPVPLKSECFAQSLSVKQLLIPGDCRSTNFDKAASWLGCRFVMSVIDAKRLYGDAAFPANFAPKARDTEAHFEYGGPDAAASDTVAGTAIFFKSSLFRADVVHPDRMTQLVLIDGIDEFVVYRDSPDQTIDPKTGKLTPDSLLGFPYSAFIVRVLTDSPFVISDVAFGIPQTAELDKFRRDGARQREITLMRGFVDMSVMTPDAIAKMQMLPHGGLTPAPPEVINGTAIKWMEHPPIPPENFAMANLISNDHDRAFGVDATASGTNDPNNVTATEAQLRQANVNVRMGKEQNAFAACYLKFVTKYSTLLQRYLTVEDAAAIVGPQKAQLWDAWRRQLPTRLAFTMLPDSMLRNDTPLERKQLQDLFTYLANDPTLNRAYLTEQLLLRYHLDPSKAVLKPQEQAQPHPDPPTLSFAIRGEDISPLSPQAPIVMEILKQQGIEISPDAIKNSLLLGQFAIATQAQTAAAKPNGQPPHPGTRVPQMPSLDKHQVEAGGANTTGALLPDAHAAPAAAGAELA